MKGLGYNAPLRTGGEGSQFLRREFEESDCVLKITDRLKKKHNLW